MRKYDSYKDSGIEWIGEIPGHWTIATVGRLTNLGRGRVISAIEIAENEGEYPVYSSQTENNGVMGRLNSFDFEGEYVTWTTDGANAGTVFYREGKFNCTNVCGTIQPKNWKQIDLKFLPYYLNLGTKFSVRLDINPKLMNNMMAKIPIVIPPKSEQTSIASFLDRKTSEIDEIIADKKRLLELYEEEKTAIINQAVTKGLDPNAPMKDSGIEWIGEIPEHWEVSRIKYYLDYQKGKNPKEINFDKGSTSEIYLAMDFLRGEPRQVLYVDDTDGYVKVDENEILLLWDGSNAGEFILSKRGILSSTMAVIYLDNIKKRYSWYYLKNFEPRLKESTIGMGIPHVNGEELKNGYITIPPISEQTSIANFLDLKTSEIDEIIADKKRLLELYEEEKTAIINKAVTKGINPDAPMKDSGIEWLGEIPEHWEVKKLNWSFEDIGSGTTPKADNQLYYYNGNINWLLTGDLNDGEIYDTSKKITQKAIDDYGTLRVYPAEIGRASCRERV